MISEKDFGGAFKFGDVFESGGGDDFSRLSEMDKEVQMDDPVNIQFTSVSPRHATSMAENISIVIFQGTTGNPKGACLSHHNIVNNAMSLGFRIGYHKKVRNLCSAFSDFPTTCTKQFS